MIFEMDGERINPYPKKIERQKMKTTVTSSCVLDRRKETDSPRRRRTAAYSCCLSVSALTC
ncbi:hypothetical protein BC2230_30250 [Burkholderia cepacia]